MRWVLQGSVDTLVRWGGQLSCHAMSNYERNSVCQKWLKSDNYSSTYRVEGIESAFPTRSLSTSLLQRLKFKTVIIRIVTVVCQFFTIYFALFVSQLSVCLHGHLFCSTERCMSSHFVTQWTCLFVILLHCIVSLSFLGKCVFLKQHIKYATLQTYTLVKTLCFC